MIDVKIRGRCKLQGESSTYIHVTIKCEGCVVLFFSYDQGSVFLPQGFCDLTRFLTRQQISTIGISARGTRGSVLGYSLCVPWPYANRICS